jgi:hypothetical protein
MSDMEQRSAAMPVIARVLLVALALADGAAAAAQGRGPGPGRNATPEHERPMVEVAPIRCWWRTSAGAVTIGEPFDVRLTCAVLEADSVQVVPDETRLSVAAVQLKPFEVLGGNHPADTRAGQRRFFQYRYTVRLLDADSIGGDVSLPNLTLTYKVQSRVAVDATLAGRDFTYVLSGLPVHVLSLVPEDGVDIRDAADVGLERLEALRFRARLFDIGALALLGAGILLAISAVVAVVGRARATPVRERSRVPDRRVLRVTRAELDRVAGDAAGGWTAELVAAGHAAMRVIASVAIGRPLAEQPLSRGAAPAEGRIAVRALLPRREGTAVTSATTASDVARALAALPLDASLAHRSGLEALRAALSVFTAAQYASGDAAPDGAALATAVETGRAEASRLERERLWPWSRPATSPGAWREGAART